MSKLPFAIAAIFLAGCASMGEWRTLSIDGSSEAAFGESLSVLNDELSYSRQQMFALALVDIVRTREQSAEQTRNGREGAYTDEDLRRELDGLTYEGVIALADSAGPPIFDQYYYYARRARAASMPPSRWGDLPGPRPAFNDNGLPAFNTWTTGWPDKGMGGDSTVAVRPDSP